MCMAASTGAGMALHKSVKLDVNLYTSMLSVLRYMY